MQISKNNENYWLEIKKNQPNYQLKRKIIIKIISDFSIAKLLRG